MVIAVVALIFGVLLGVFILLPRNRKSGIASFPAFFFGHYSII